MLKVYKYEINRFAGVINMPEPKKILKVGYQGEVLSLWAVVDPDEPVKAVPVSVVGTGWDLECDYSKYVDTVKDGDGFVWHIFLD